MTLMKRTIAMLVVLFSFALITSGCLVRTGHHHHGRRSAVRSGHHHHHGPGRRGRGHAHGHQRGRGNPHRR
jgi:hypothetical protein